MARTELDFNKGFKFSLGDFNGAEKVDFDDSGWQAINAPHDWSIYGEFKIDNPTGAAAGFRPAGIGWYRKKFFIPFEYEGKQIIIDADGIYRRPTIFVNGKKVAYWVNGYVPQKIDITKFLKYGEENLVAIKVDNSLQPASRYFTGAGINRNIKLIVRDFVNIKNTVPFVTTPFASDELAEINIETEVENQLKSLKTVSIVYKVADDKGNIVDQYTEDNVNVSAGGTQKVVTKIYLKNPKLWDIQNPHLYNLTTEVLVDGKVTDNSLLKFGVRSFAFDSEKGFFLNGKSVYIKGVCLHHDNGALGAAVNKAADRRKLLVMREMGVNAIRLAHNPYSDSFLDVCDELGFLVMDEFFDEWRIQKRNMVPDENGINQRVDAHYYHEFFDDCWEEDITKTVIRDRNHPSIIMYSIGNEIPEQRDCIKGAEKIAAMLVSKVKEYDKTRPVTNGCLFNYNEKADLEPFCDYLDVAGYNYAEEWYQKHKKMFKDRCIIGTEDVSVVPFWKRGEYDLKVLSEINRTVESSVGECLDTSYVRICSGEWSMRKHLSNRQVSGFFIWTGVDYLGEPTPYNWPSRSSYFGATDTCCFPKDSFYFYKSYWDNEPVLHIFPHWNLNLPEGTMVDVIAYTNCGSAELFINGKSYGISNFDPEKGEHLSWKVPYIPGEIKAVGFNEKGEPIITDVIKTAGEPVKLSLEIDRDKIARDGDTAFITATLLDENNNIVPTNPKEIKFIVEDGLCLDGVDNGDPEYTGDLKGNTIPTLSGKALAIISSVESVGSFKVTANIKNLCSTSVTVTVY